MMLDKTQNIALLREKVAESTNRKIKTSSDFIFLAGEIQVRVRQPISVATLKRIWGYVDGYENTRESTLDILAQFVGFSDWETFVSDYCEVDSVQSSHRVVSKTILSRNLPLGAELLVCWNPNRQCIFHHFGAGLFEVSQSQNAKLKVGVRFHCERFTFGQPLYVELVDSSTPNELFVMGQKGGLTELKKL